MALRCSFPSHCATSPDSRIQRTHPHLPPPSTDTSTSFDVLKALSLSLRAVRPNILVGIAPDSIHIASSHGAPAIPRDIRLYVTSRSCKVLFEASNSGFFQLLHPELVLIRFSTHGQSLVFLPLHRAQRSQRIHRRGYYSKYHRPHHLPPHPVPSCPPRSEGRPSGVSTAVHDHAARLRPPDC